MELETFVDSKVFKFHSYHRDTLLPPHLFVRSTVKYDMKIECSLIMLYEGSTHWKNTRQNSKEPAKEI